MINIEDWKAFKEYADEINFQIKKSVCDLEVPQSRTIEQKFLWFKWKTEIRTNPLDWLMYANRREFILRSLIPLTVEECLNWLARGRK